MAEVIVQALVGMGELVLIMAVSGWLLYVGYVVYETIRSKRRD